MAVAESCVNPLKDSLNRKIASLPSSTQVYMFKLERLTKIFCVCVFNDFSEVVVRTVTLKIKAVT